MRFYRIEIFDATSKQPILPTSLGNLGITSLLPSGGVNPAALTVEFDIPVAPLHVPNGQAFVRIWGIGLQQIGQAFNLNGADIKVYGGMSKGLPLANPAQQKLLVSGTILQAFGNWVGTDQTIDLILSPQTGTNDKPLNVVLNWLAGTPLADALKVTLKTALPQAVQKISVSPRLVLNHNQPGYYNTVEQLAGVIYDLSKSIITDAGYPGVAIGYDGVTVTVSDQSSPLPPTAIAFQDLIGQPTWVEPQIIQVKTVMRGDIGINDVVTLPQGVVSTTANALRRFQDETTFSGNYVVNAMHHFGASRQPDAASWNTTMNMYPLPKTAASTTTSDLTPAQQELIAANNSLLPGRGGRP